MASLADLFARPQTQGAPGTVAGGSVPFGAPPGQALPPQRSPVTPNTPRNPTGIFNSRGAGGTPRGLPQRRAGAPIQAQPFQFDQFSQFGDAVFDQLNSRLQPQLQQQEDALRQRLINQGLQPGTQAFDAELGAFGRGRNDALTSIGNQAVLTGLGAQNQAFQQALAPRQLQNQFDIAQMGLQGQLAGAGASRANAQTNAATQIQLQELRNQLGFAQNDTQRLLGLGNLGLGFRGQDIGRSNFLDQLDFNQGQADFNNLLGLGQFGLGAAGFNNNALNNDFARSTALLGLLPGGNVSPINVSGIFGQGLQADLANAQANANSRNGLFGAIGGIGRTILGGGLFGG